MTKGNYVEYLKSPWWQERRKLILETFNFCQRCNFPYELDVHHLTYERLGKERDSDLEVLCRACHMREHVTANEAQFSGLTITVLREKIRDRTQEAYERNVERFYEVRKNKERDEED